MYVLRKKKVFHISSADSPSAYKLNDIETIAELRRQSELVESERPKVFAKQVITLDVDGNEISKSTTRITTQNGSGFVLSYSDKLCDLVSKVTQPTILRVFIYLSHNQSYEGGFRVSRKHISEALNLDPKSVYSALKWLQNNFLVLESRIDGQTEIMVNPNYVTVGRDKKARLQLWSERWQDYWQHTGGQNKSINSRVVVKEVGR